MAQYDLPYTGPQVEALLAKISELESEMPSKTSDLTNDSGFITSADVPTKTSDLNNDSGFITNAPVAAEAARAQAAEALLATISSLQAEITRATGVEGTLQDLIDGIAAKIPSAATEQNQLADKSYVNASIATASATFRGTYISLVALQSVAADENDYGYVISTDAVGNTIYNRYKYANSTWIFEYAIANPIFDSSQWAAINSSVTAELVAKLSALPDNATLTTALAAKQDVIDDLSSIRSKANSAYQKPSDGIPASDIADGVIPDVSGKVNTSDIADNLTTNDATKVLSAKQGKVLNENLTQLGQKVTEIGFIENGKYYVNNTVGNAVTKTSQTGLACVLIPVIEGMEFTVVGTPSSNARLWSTVDADLKVVRCSSFTSGSRTEDVTIASGEAYLICNTYTSNTNAKVTLTEGHIIDIADRIKMLLDAETTARKSSDNQISSDIIGINNSISAINAELDSQLLLPFVDDGKYYVFSAQNAVVRKLVGAGYYTVSIKVSAGMQFKIKGAGGSSTARLWIMADKDQMALSAADASAIADGLVLTIGNDVEYLYINIANTSTAPYVRQLTSGADILNSLALAQSIDDDLHDLTIDYFAAGQNLLSGDYLNSSSKVWEDGLYGADTYCGGSTTTKSMVRPFRLPKGVYMLYMTVTTSRYLLYDKRWNLIETGSNNSNKITITDDFAYIVISCLTANVASLQIISAVPVLKDVLLPQSDSEFLSLAKSENAFNTDGESLLNDMSITNSDYVTGCWVAGVWQSSNKSTPLIPIKRGTKLDVFFWSATTPSSTFGVTVLKNGKFIKTYTCDLVSDETSIMSKTARVHSTNTTLYKAHFPADFFDSDGMTIQISGTTAICKMGNVFLFTYGSSLVMKEPDMKGLFRFDDLSTQKVFPMTVTGTAGQPSAKYALKVPISDNFNIRFKFRITDALVNGDYAWALAWAANTAYAVGDYVRYSSVTYICKTAHTSSSSFDSSKWNIAFLNVASVLGARANVIPQKLSQVTSSYTYDGSSYTSYYPSFNGGLKYHSAVSLDNRKFKTYLGDFAMSVRYTGSGSSASVENTGSAIVLKEDGATVATLSFSTYDTMTKLYEAIKSVTGFAVDYGEITDRTPHELAKFGETQLISTYYGNISGVKPTNDNQVQYTDNAPLFIPYAVASEWVQAEIVGIGNTIYVGIDGITNSYSRKMGSVAQLVLGGDFGVLFKDIEIDLTSSRDAEVGTNYHPTSPITNILISSANPFTVIFEGHGMADDIADSPDYPGDNMSAPTEWLQRVFNDAFAKGYVPVTLEDIIAHYKIGTPLPKRCFTAIFDDFRFTNFLNLKFRSVFTRNGIFASLAVISNQQNTITYNGQTITMEKAVAIGKNAGFECYSHTKDHRHMESEKPSDFISLAQGDIYDGDEKGINPNILIFPYGNNTPYLIDTLRWIGLNGGVTIDVDNPVGNNPWCLVRHEIGTRAEITNIFEELL